MGCAVYFLRKNVRQTHLSTSRCNMFYFFLLFACIGVSSFLIFPFSCVLVFVRRVRDRWEGDEWIVVIVDNDGDENEGHTHKVRYACFYFRLEGYSFVSSTSLLRGDLSV